MTAYDSHIDQRNSHRHAVSRKDILGIGGNNAILVHNTGTLACIENNLQQLHNLGFEVLMAEPQHWILRRNGVLPEFHLYSTDELALFARQQATKSANDITNQEPS